MKEEKEREKERGNERISGIQVRTKVDSLTISENMADYSM